MVKKWGEFIREFVENENYLDAKMQEIKDLIDNIAEGQSLIYEWENKNDHELFINFTTDEVTLRYEFDIDDLKLTKIASNVIDFETAVNSVDDGLSIIEKDIHSVLGIDEKAKTPGEEYKGHHVPAKYLTRKKKAMKKEIDTFRGKKEYKKDWEADIDKRTDKRIPTKKSAATKAFQKMFSENVSEAKKSSGVETGLKNKAKVSGIPLGILRKVFAKGMQAWNAGHRPGVAQHQWAMGRVNSFITGSGGSRKADADLWAKAKAAKSKKNEDYQGQWESSLKTQDVRKIYPTIKRILEIYPGESADSEGIIEELERKLSNYDNEVIEEVIDILMFGDPNISFDNLERKLIDLGDKINDKQGTEPIMIIRAFEEAFEVIERHFYLTEKNTNLKEFKKIFNKLITESKYEENITIVIEAGEGNSYIKNKSFNLEINKKLMKILDKQFNLDLGEITDKHKIEGSKVSEISKFLTSIGLKKDEVKNKDRVKLSFGGKLTLKELKKIK